MVTINAIDTQNPIQVAKGGTGVASNTAYAVLCGGTTAAGAIQSIASVGTSGQVLTSNGAGALPTFQDGGTCLQQVRTTFSTQGVTTAVIPYDNTIPQQTEGFEIITATITPKSASSVLYINVQLFLDAVTTRWPLGAIFRDSTANAIAAWAWGAGSYPYPASASCFTNSSSTASTTFKCRIGTNGGDNIYYNQDETSVQIFGGVFVCTMTVTEYSS